MLLRTKPLIASLPLLVLAACDWSECEPTTPAAEPIGFELFAVDSVMDETKPRTLYRDGAQVQLLAGPETSLEVRATLSAEALESIEQAESAIGGGEPLGSFDPSCLTFIDRPSVTLSLVVAYGSLNFGYSWGCPPEGLTDVDAVLRELMDSLPECSATPLLSECNLISE